MNIHGIKARVIALTLVIALLAVVAPAFTSTAEVSAAETKSLYVIANINANPTPIQAYHIQGNQLLYQSSHGVPRYAGGGVGLAIDADAEILFVTYEVSNVIQLVDAKTFAGLGSTTAPNARNLAGIVVDHDNSKVYTVDRNTNHLYVYSWNAATKILTNDNPSPYYISLPGVSGAHGLALDETNGLLYIGDRTTSVKIFNTSGWSSAGSVSVTQSVMGIAVDVNNGFVYTGNAYQGYGSTGLLEKHDMNTAATTSVNIRTLPGGVSNDNVVGLAVDQDTGLVYITTGSQASGGTDRIIVFDSSLNMLSATGSIGNPTGIVVPGKAISYNPLNLQKSDGLGEDECVSPGQNITYTLSYDNQNPNDVTGVTITDALPLTYVDFVSASDGGTLSGNIVTWDIGTVATGTSGSVTVTVQVKSGTSAGITITNNSDIDCDQTGPAFASEDTDTCTNQPPVAVCKDFTLDLDANGQATLAAADVDGGSSDPDAGDTITLSIDKTDFTCADIGANTVTLTVSDGQATATCESTVTVQDVTAPDITCPADVTLECPADTTPAGTGEATATDSCSAVTITYADAVAPGCGNTETITRTWTATDGSGNSSTCVQVITVVDTTAPMLTVPGDVTVEQQTTAGAVVPLSASATDTCDDDVAVADDAPAIFPVGATTVTFTATDDCGNSSQDSTTVTIQGPQEIKANANTCLSNYIDESKRFGKAIKEIAQSLNPKYWLDVSHLDCKHGHRVFSEERHAVKELMHLLKGTPADGKCDGIALIELEYLGAGTVDVEVYLKKDLLGTFTVSEGETFVVEATEATKGELHSEITLIVNGEEAAKIHTSCSKEIEIGDVQGDFEITDLEKLYKESKGKKDQVSAEALACAQESIEKLVRADRILAETLLIEAEGTAVVNPKNQKKVDKELAKSNEELAKGDADRDAGKFDKAIQHYKKAWEHSCHAIKEATKTKGKK